MNWHTEDAPDMHAVQNNTVTPPSTPITLLKSTMNIPSFASISTTKHAKRNQSLNDWEEDDTISTNALQPNLLNI